MSPRLSARRSPSFALCALGHWRHYGLPVIAGFLTGVVGLWFPEVMGAGYDAINSALHGQFPWNFMLFIGLAKILVTLLCFIAETPGGMFALALFIGAVLRAKRARGAMIGGALGGLTHRF